jgi:hypothetical protein
MRYPHTLSTSSEQSLLVARKWLNQCIHTHESCQGPKHGSWYPTRLIRIDPVGNSFKIRLQNCRETPPNGPYMTLSHRWGDRSILQLTADKLQDMSQDIPPAALSKTFRDAVDIAIAFNVFYIWIDSICIVQDSEDDWEFEAGLMKQAYQHSICTLAATSSKAADCGLYSERNPEDLSPSKIKMDWSTSQTYSIIDAYIWDREVTDSALCRRAWVVQERLLSQRVLHFGTEQLLWECRELDACETFPNGFPELPRWAKTPFGAFKDLENVRGRYGSESASPSKYRIWYRILENYSGCGLTEASDKLVALSGVAAHVKDTLRDEYVAGLWKADFPKGLLWAVQPRNPAHDIPSVRPLEYRAPSWSWAAMDGIISCDLVSKAGGDLVATLIDVKVGLRSGNTTGGVISGHISLIGRLLAAAWTNDPDFPIPRIEVAHWSHIPKAVNVAYPDVWSDVNSLAIYILPIFTKKGGDDPKQRGESYMILGIVLRPIDPPPGMEASAQCFRRVGVCVVYSSCSLQAWGDTPETLVYVF